VEHIIPDTHTPDFASMFDMHMMCWGSGRERTEREYRDLLRQSCWTFVASWYAQSGVICVIEGAKSP